MTYDELKTRLLKLSEELDASLQSDGEHGVRWLNEEASKKFKQSHPALIEWLNRFQSLSYAVELDGMCPECGGTGRRTSEVQARYGDEGHPCERCNSTGKI